MKFDKIRERLDEFEKSEAVVRECFLCVAGENYGKDIYALLDEINRYKAWCERKNELIVKLSHETRKANDRIEQLEAELAGYRGTERDAAIEDLNRLTAEINDFEELATKLNVLDLVRENHRVQNSLRYAEAKNSILTAKVKQLEVDPILPCDVKVGHGIFKRGVKLSTLMLGIENQNRYRAEDKAELARYREAEQPEPLTLKQIRERVGKPIYHVCKTGARFWDIVDGWNIAEDSPIWSDYGKDFVCYDREPRQEP